MLLKDKVFETAIEYYNRQYSGEAESAKKKLLDTVYLYLNEWGMVPSKMRALRDEVFETVIEYHNKQCSDEAESARKKLLDTVELYLTLWGTIPPEILALKAARDETARNAK